MEGIWTCMTQGCVFFSGPQNSYWIEGSGFLGHEIELVVVVLKRMCFLPPTCRKWSRLTRAYFSDGLVKKPSSLGFGMFFSSSCFNDIFILNLKMDPDWADVFPIKDGGIFQPARVISWCYRLCERIISCFFFRITFFASNDGWKRVKTDCYPPGN